MPAKHQPDLIYLRYVPLWKVHIFTLVQLTCLVLLWVIKASAAAVVFPMMVTTSLTSALLRNENIPSHVKFDCAGSGAGLCAKASGLFLLQERFELVG